MDFFFKVGGDCGNSEYDIYINKTLIKQPNVNVEVDVLNAYDDQGSEAILSDIMNKIVVSIDSNSCSSGTYLIGNSALKSGEVLNNFQVGLDKKSSSELPIINTLGLIACYSVKEYFEQNQEIPKKISVNVDMTTSLPIGEYFENDNNKRNFKNKFEEEIHYVTVHLGKQRVRVEIDFEYVKVVPEATPVVFSLIEDKDGNVREGEFFKEFLKENSHFDKISGDFFSNKRILHLDVGDGTTEVPITEGISPLPQFSQGYHYGVGHAIENSLEKYAQLVNLPSVQRQELSDVLKNPKHKYYNRAIKAIVPHLKVQGREILKKVKQQITRANNEVDILVVYGGGSILLRKVIEPSLKLLCKEREIDLFYVSSEYAVTMNAEGLSNFVNGAIFEHLKEKETSKKEVVESN